MADRKVTDPALLEQLNSTSGKDGRVVDQETLKKLNSKPYSGAILPFTRDEKGVRFDSNAGLVGALKRAIMLPGEVYSGQVDPQSNEGIDRAIEAAGMITPASPAKAALAKSVAVPTSQELKAASKAGYDAVRNMGVEYRPEAVGALAAKTAADLEQKGILGELAPKTHAILGKLNPTDDAVSAPFQNMEAARRALGHAGKDFANPTDQLASRHALSALDEFLSSPNPANVLRGDPVAASRLVTEARGNYAAAKRGETIDKVRSGADLQAAAANSGQNIDNSIRQRLKSILLNERQAARFNPDEQAILEGVVKGGPVINRTRDLANLLGGGRGLGAVVTGLTAGAAGGAAGSPTLGAIMGVGAPATGMLAKALENHMARRALNSADEAMRARSPLYEQRYAAAPSPQYADPSSKEALVKMLLSEAAMAAPGAAIPAQSASPADQEINRLLKALMGAEKP